MKLENDKEDTSLQLLRVFAVFRYWVLVVSVEIMLCVAIISSQSPHADCLYTHTGAWCRVLLLVFSGANTAGSHLPRKEPNLYFYHQPPEPP